ncbi:MAG: hypothetical protein HUJ62_05580 [Streptococcus gallolyticus]|nr:hypothetical protein [Streptococcus gallolyticus]
MAEVKLEDTFKNRDDFSNSHSSKSKSIVKRNEAKLNDISKKSSSMADIVLYDVVLPTAKRMLFDVAKGFMDMVKDSLAKSLDIDTRSQGRNGKYTDYSKYSSRRYYDGPGDPRNRDRRYDRSSYSRLGNQSGLRQPVPPFKSKMDAEDFILDMIAHMEEYDVLTVPDYYGYFDIQTDFYDEEWGWDDPDEIARLRPKRTSRGWVVDMPRPIALSEAPF